MRALLRSLLLVLAIPGLSHAAAVVWTCTAPKSAFVDTLGYLATTTCTSDGGTYTTAGDALGVGGAATAASAGATLCGSSARIPVAVFASTGATIAGQGLNPAVYDLSAWKLRLFEGSAAGTILSEKTNTEAITSTLAVTLLSICK